MRQMGQAAARMLMGYFGGTPLPETPAGAADDA